MQMLILLNQIWRKKTLAICIVSNARSMNLEKYFSERLYVKLPTCWNDEKLCWLSNCKPNYETHFIHLPQMILQKSKRFNYLVYFNYRRKWANNVRARVCVCMSMYSSDCVLNLLKLLSWLLFTIAHSCTGMMMMMMIILLIAANYFGH